MVCRRCIDVVRTTALDLGLTVENVRMGQATFPKKLTPQERAAFLRGIKQHGFDLLETRQSKTVEAIKRLLLDRASNRGSGLGENLSSYLSRELKYEYGHLSKVFSKSQGVTIERFFTLQRLDRVKELLAYDEQSITEIASELGFSSSAHLSATFKKETGMTPREFRKIAAKSRKMP
ncbi:AraC family transcriptional regulator [Pelagicoccus sp. SDUM812003]|uniref:helix-turn-helix domain-containing protein n=1 Tax=Pelagicoccus sp. SDUM812003 TaxID=3041267 RepID=UPI0028109439|nr:AraC family transcriptional regulator [Pelagicoccus sp. SDUM812003]MDQ8204744.1 AraC family transcriptional regulator [Pelagicoccus sp. SDUM812003]